LTQEAEETSLANANLSLGAVSEAASDTVVADLVISQSPTGGNDVAPYSAVAITVLTGPGTAGECECETFETTVTGRLVYNDESPVKGATITSSFEGTVSSDANGDFSLVITVTGNPASPPDVTISATVSVEQTRPGRGQLWQPGLVRALGQWRRYLPIGIDHHVGWAHGHGAGRL
tara:strand:+ start:224 stop:751 length:528 start_codon:yes stop_codon:yes gene_type:complete